MIISTIEQLKKRKEADLMILPFWQSPNKGKKNPLPAAVFPELVDPITPALNSGDFKGESGETLLIYLEGKKEPRCLLLGLGTEGNLSTEGLRLAYSNAIKICQKKGAKKLNVVVPTISELRNIDLKDCLRGIIEGILLTNYQWESIDTGIVLIENICLIGVLPIHLEFVQEYLDIAKGVYLARNLVNGNADLVTPQYLAEIAQKIAQKFPSKVKARILDKSKIEKEKMGFFLAVARGAAVDPAFIILSYKGFPASKEHTIIVGKGVTFDTGGLNLKPHQSMLTMRDDMAGAATALATVEVAAALNIKQNVTAVVAATENAIGSRSFKPGDVYIGYNGAKIEIHDTDAEGRLTLADALAFSVQELKPTRMIDLATLTGSMVVALGEGMSGFFCNDDQLAGALLDASFRTSEQLWRMPLYSPYKDLLKSDIADMKNVGGRAGGAITAALFLQEFVKNIPWAHIDIAGTAFASKEKGYWPKNGVGFGVRLLIDFLQAHSKKNNYLS